VDCVEPDLPIRENVPLAPLTTPEVGGPARYFLEAVDDQVMAAALAWANRAAA